MEEKEGLCIDYFKNILVITAEDKNDIGLSHLSYPRVTHNLKINDENTMALDIGKTILWLYTFPALPKRLDSSDNSGWIPYIKGLGAKSNRDYYTNALSISLVKLMPDTVMFSLWKSTSKGFVSFDDPKDFTCSFEAETMGKKVLEIIAIGKELMNIE